ncbi:unnamed protein product, partial [Nesidiocoris tenuis]
MVWNVRAATVILVIYLAAQTSGFGWQFLDEDDSGSSESSSNSTETDDCLGTILSLIGFSNCGGRTTTTKKPLTGTTTTTTMKPVTIKCSNETCPSNCRTDPAIIHGFCCNCKLPM